MLLAGDQHIVFPIQHLAMQVLGDGVHGEQGEIDGAILELPEHLGVTCVAYRDSYCWSRTPQLRDQRQHDRMLGVIRCGDLPGHLGRSGVEAARLAEHAPEFRQYRADGRQQRQRTRRRRHSPGSRSEQRVGEHLPQLAQLHADRRLAQVQAPGGPGDAAFGQQRFQCDQQVEIDPTEIIHGYRPYQNYSFPL
jgi:hypothetical protein